MLTYTDVCRRMLTHADLAGHGCAEDDERVCRICQCSEEEVPEYGKLFSPCLCRGTMRYIHQVS